MPERQSPGPWGRRAIIAALLATMALQVGWFITTNSPTFDESNHVARGYAILRTGDFRLSLAHPPLLNLLSALPLLTQPPLELPLARDSWRKAEIWDFAHQLIWHGGGDPIRAINLGRLPILLLGLSLGLLVFLWASQLYGRRAGLLALFLFAFEPNILAHSGLATTDLGVTALAFAAVYCLWRYLQEPSRCRLALAGIVFGLAQLAKFSAVILLPTYVVLIVIWGIARHGHTGFGHAMSGLRFFGRAALALVIIGVIGGIVIWAGYGFQTEPLLPPGKTTQLEQMLGPAAATVRAHPALARLPVPARQYLRGLMTVRGHEDKGHRAFLMGQRSSRGWWYYFLVVGAIKTPIPLLLLALAAAVVSLRRRERDEWFLLVPVAMWLLAASLSHLNIGLRHLLPIFPFLIVFASKVAAPGAVASRRPWTRTAAGVALGLAMIWQAVGTLRIAPQYLAYFNESIGGPAHGYKYVVDSNLDWGQDLGRLARWWEAEGRPPIHLSYYGSADPARYEIEYQPLPTVAFWDCAELLPEAHWAEASRPRSGWIVISATCLQNIGSYLGEDVNFDWLRAYDPVARVGHSILVYKIPPDPS